MNRALLIALSIPVVTSAFGQWSPSFKLLRYEEDYSFIKDVDPKTWYDGLKFTPLNKDARRYMSIGGDVRFQYFFYENEAWGEIPDDDDGFILTRLLLHSDIQLNEWVRLFIQLQGSGASGRVDPSPVEENPLDLHQAFIEYRKALSDQIKLQIMAGRQELSYGSQRLISVREGPNTRNAFDSFKAIITSSRSRMDVFYGLYVYARPGIFDDKVNNATQIWGAYFVRNDVPAVSNVDLYYLGLVKEGAVFDDGRGREQRHSVGSRIWGKKQGWTYNVEGLYQFGKLLSKTISAWTMSADIAYAFSNRKYLREIGLKTELISGDHARGDNYLQTFNPLFPRGAYFGLAALIGPSNLIDVHPSVAFSLTRAITWNIDFDIFWRNRQSDGIYAPNVELIYSGNGTESKFIGSQLGTDLKFNIAPFISASVEFTWFDTGKYLKEVGPGKDILFTSMTLQIRF